jgi:hypothetical protein
VKPLDFVRGELPRLSTEVVGAPAVVTFDGKHVLAASMDRVRLIMPGSVGWVKWSKIAVQRSGRSDQGDGEKRTRLAPDPCRSKVNANRERTRYVQPLGLSPLAWWRGRVWDWHLVPLVPG